MVVRRPIRCLGPVVLALSIAGAAYFSPTPIAHASAGEGVTSLSGNFLAGHVAQKRRDLPAAVKYLGQVLTQDATQPDFLRRAFLFSLMNGEVDRALELAAQYAEAGERGPISTLALAVDDIKNGNWDDADQKLAELDVSGLSSFTVPITRAWIAFEKSGKDAGLEMLTPLRDASGMQVLHDMHAGMMHEIAGDLATAETYYLNLAEQENGMTLRGTRILGTLYERQGKKAEARAIYDMYLQNQPSSQLLENDIARLEAGGQVPVLVANPTQAIAEGLFGIASSLNRQRGHETSLVMGHLALHLRPDFAIMQFVIADVLEAMERFDDAIAMYRTLPEQSGFSRSAKLSIAHALNRLERIDEAVDLMRELARDNASDPAASMALGDILRTAQRWDEAIVAYDEAFARIGEPEQKHWRLLYTRGIVLERAKDWDRAEADFLKALEFEPDHPLILNYLGYSWIEKRKNLDQALQMIKTAVAKRPHDGYIVDSLGWGYYTLGRYEEAVPELERAVELRPEDPIINDHLGDAYWKVGRKLEATFQWNHALSLDPEPELKEIIERKLQDGLVEGAENVTPTTTDGG